jgi:hypothetical protein
MAQLFRPGANSLATLSLYLGAAAPFVLIIVISQITRSPYNTKVDVPINQPVPFSHKHHAWELGIDCRFCHGGVEESPHSNVPTTEVCMTCHSQVWTNSPLLEPVRTSYATNEPLQWARVNKLPDFVYFNHAIHIDRGISCNNCHGAVQEMHITHKARPFTMAWCLECHRNPEEYLYDDGDPDTTGREQVFALYDKIATGAPLEPVEAQLARGQEQHMPGNDEEGQMLVNEYNIDPAQLTDCYTCHH